MHINNYKRPKHIHIKITRVRSITSNINLSTTQLLNSSMTKGVTEKIRRIKSKKQKLSTTHEKVEAKDNLEGVETQGDEEI